MNEDNTKKLLKDFPNLYKQYYDEFKQFNGKNITSFNCSV
jgi:hypothetical protein